jgi:hypothetical protein
MLAVTTDCPSTAMDWVRAVAMSLLLASTSDDDMTVPLTKLGYGFEYVPDPLRAIYLAPKSILFR